MTWPIGRNHKVNFKEAMSPRREFYLPVLPEIRKIMIGRMAKPEEVLVVENDNGEVIREQFKVTLSIKYLVLIFIFSRTRTRSICTRQCVKRWFT